MGTITHLGLAKPDDPIYSSGPMVSFRPQLTPSTATSLEDTDGTKAPARSTSADDPNRPETEEDGIRAEAIRREKVRRLSPAYRKSKEKPSQIRE
jgi:hypothetical protein